MVTAVTLCAIAALLAAPVGGKAYLRWRARKARVRLGVVRYLDDRRVKSD